MDDQDYETADREYRPWDRWLDRLAGPYGGLILACAAGLAFVVGFAAAVTMAGGS